MNAVLILSLMSVGQVRGLEVGSAALVTAIARENARAVAAGDSPDEVRRQQKAKADAKQALAIKLKLAKPVMGLGAPEVDDDGADAKAKAPKFDPVAEAAKAKAKAEANAVLQKKIDANKVEIEVLRAKVAMLDKAHRASAKKSMAADKADDLVNMKKYKDQSMAEYAEWKATKSKMESLQEEVRKLALQVAYN